MAATIAMRRLGDAVHPIVGPAAGPTAQRGQDFTPPARHGIVFAVPTSRFTVRLPQRTRMVIAAFGAVWCSATLALAVVPIVSGASHSVLGAVLPAVLFIAGGATLRRLARVSVLAIDDMITVRNMSTTYRIGRDQITGFGTGTMTMGRRRTVTLDTRSGPVPMDVFAYGEHSDRADYEQRLQTVRAWVAARAEQT
jgi:hypothetical protein